MATELVMERSTEERKCERCGWPRKVKVRITVHPSGRREDWSNPHCTACAAEVNAEKHGRSEDAFLADAFAIRLKRAKAGHREQAEYVRAYVRRREEARLRDAVRALRAGKIDVLRLVKQELAS